MKTRQRILNYFLSFEFFLLFALLTFWLDASLTLIGVGFYGPQMEGNPIVQQVIMTGKFYVPLMVIPLMLFIFFGMKYLWNYKSLKHPRSSRAICTGAKVMAWVWILIYFYVAPFSWLFYIYLI